MLAFVLSGGGARGAYQVGALRALLEAGYRPDLLVGTSIGAVNATYLALHGVDVACVDKLAAVWQETSELDIITSGRAWLAARALFRIADNRYYERLRELYIQHGLTPDLRFEHIQGVRLIVVAADLNTQQPVLFGANPDDVLLDSLLASTAIPPWIPPIAQDGRLLTDGGIASNVPIEPALNQGATEIIVLNLVDPRGIDPQAQSIGAIISKMTATVAAREVYLEQALAEAKGVALHSLDLHGEKMVPLWDFSHTGKLIEQGYSITRQTIADWQEQPRGAYSLQTLRQVIAEFMQQFR